MEDTTNIQCEQWLFFIKATPSFLAPRFHLEFHWTPIMSGRRLKRSFAKNRTISDRRRTCSSTTMRGNASKLDFVVTFVTKKRQKYENNIRLKFKKIKYLFRVKYRFFDLQFYSIIYSISVVLLGGSTGTATVACFHGDSNEKHNVSTQKTR